MLPSRYTDFAVLVQNVGPVQQMGFTDLSFHKPSSAQCVIAKDSSVPSKEDHLYSSPARMSSPINSSEAAYTNTFVPVDTKADPISKDSSAYGIHADVDQHCLSAETNSSWEGETFAYDKNAEVSSCVMAFS